MVKLSINDLKIGVIGLGYVGLPIAVEFAKKYHVVGFDINKAKVDLLKQNIDPSNEIEREELTQVDLHYTCESNDLKNCNFYVVAVPTPVDNHKVPDLNAIKSASKLVGDNLSIGDYVVFESTVYPGCTEEICLPILEESSGLQFKSQFKIGYSPERINPGDKLHTLTKITKVVSGCDEESLEFISQVYGSIIEAGIFNAASIKVAEAAKVIENTQRDVNIALMNELAIIFDKLDINTNDVLEAAGTKWNFLKFYPGLVGGHCIGVDPYYLTYKSQQLGYTPEVILGGRRINDNTPKFITDKIVRALTKMNKKLQDCNVLIKGITFKENVSDIRNSKVFNLYKELRAFSVNVDITDPKASPQEVKHEYNIELTAQLNKKYDVIILAVSHDEFKIKDLTQWQDHMNDPVVFFDVKSIFAKSEKPDSVIYLNL